MRLTRVVRFAPLLMLGVVACEVADEEAGLPKGGAGGEAAACCASGPSGSGATPASTAATDGGVAGPPGTAEDGGTSTCAPPACLPDASTTVPMGPSPIPADRATEWNPGILEDTLLHLPLGADGLPQRTAACATLTPGADIQAAIDACPSGKVVVLGPGTYTVASTIRLKSGVVLRGAGSGGAPSGTTIVKTGGETVIAIGNDQDTPCYGGTAYPLTADALKESKTIKVGAAASHFASGDLALVDVVDDATVDQGDCPYFKRASGRSVSQRVEIASVDVANGTVTTSAPLHWTFKSAGPYLGQITKAVGTVIRWAGVESVRVQGGTNPGYNGQMAGGIDISNAAYSWVKDVQTDGTIGGMHVSLTGTYRTVVRDGYFHHSADYGFGHDCYGIVLRCGAADNLVENNVARYMNKPIMFNVSGGGNVVGYNYADNSWASPAEWQEVNIDTHCAFPHMELMEGNEAPHMGATVTHGNAGYLTFYRNHASSQFATPAVAGSNATQNGNVAALQFDHGDIAMNVLGNVLGASGVSKVVDSADSSQSAVYELGSGGAGLADVAATSLLRHGNYDFVTNSTSYSSTLANHTLPASLYKKGRPGWWPAASPWPWVGPDLQPMVGTLPAKDRAAKL